MKKKGFLRRIFGKRTKTGASLLVVLVSITMLIIMGTGFSVIAMNGYNNSHRRMCQQQAYYTATACIDLINLNIANNPNGEIINHIKQKIIHTKELYDQDHPGAPINYTSLSVEIANIEDEDGMRVPSSPVEGALLGIVGGCQVRVQPIDEALTQLRISAIGKYKGYTQTVSARIACTTRGAIELKKVFSNSQCWKTPIVTIVAGKTTGDMYFASPGVYKRYGATPDNPYAGEIDVGNADNEELRSKVYGNVASGAKTAQSVAVHTKPFNIYNKPVHSILTRTISQERYQWYWDHRAKIDLTGQGVIDKQNEARFEIFPEKNGKFDMNPPANAEYANYYWPYTTDEEYDYIRNGNCDPAVIVQSVPYKEHHMTKDMNNKIVKGPGVSTIQDAKNWYNDWVEIYMTTGETDGTTSTPIVNGDMYCDTQALIGLFDRDPAQRKWWHYYDFASDTAKVERKYVQYAGTKFGVGGNPTYAKKYREGYPLGENFEHGGTGNLFYDYNSGGPSFDASTFRHNGNMYLFYDTRIESYDSLHTPNAVKGIKNNIFAQHNLSIDGFAYGYNGHEANDDVPGVTNVQIYGDIMCKGNLCISGATIYGDVYCAGDELDIVDSVIYGDIIYDHVRCRMDGVEVRNSPFTFNYDGKTITQHLTGGNVTILGEDIPYTNYWDFDKKTLTSGTTFYADKTDYLRDFGTNCVTSKGDNHNKNAFAYETDRVDGQTLTDLLVKKIWGVVLTNCSVEETVYSNVNTQIKVSSTRALGDTSKINGKARSRINLYNNIFVTKGLFIDGRARYLYNDKLSNDWGEELAGGAYKGSILGRNILLAQNENRIRVRGAIMCNRLMIMQPQEEADGNLERAYLYFFSEQDKSTYGDNLEPLYEDFRAQGIQDADFGKYLDNMQISFVFNKIFTGEGGFYIDGTQWIVCKFTEAKKWGTAGFYKYGYNEEYYRGKDDNKSIQIAEFYTTADAQDMCNMWDASGGATNIVDFSEAQYKHHNNFTDISWGSGKGRNQDTYNNMIKNISHKSIKFYYNKQHTALDSWGASSSQRVVENHPTTNTEILLAAQAQIAQFIEDNGELVLDATGKPIIDNITGKPKRVNHFDYQTKFTTANTTALVLDVVKDYFINYKSINRINNYYSKFMAKQEDEKIARLYKHYKNLTTLGNWSRDDKEEGPFPSYDPHENEGIWRRVTVLKWYAPDNDPSGKTGVPYVMIPGTTDKSVADLPDTVCHKGIIDGKQAYIIDTSFSYDGKLVIPANTIVVLDSHKNNNHILLKKGIRLENNSKLVQTGGNMTFFYLGEEPKYDVITNEFTGQVTSVPKGLNNADPMANVLFYAGENVEIGAVVGEEVGDKRQDSTYFISNAICHIHMGSGASLHGYMYLPYGHLFIDAVPADAVEHTVLHGSMLVRTLIVDVGTSYEGIKNAYDRLLYEYEMSPLIVDGQIDYGDKNNPNDSLNIFNENSWGFVGYE